MTLRNGLKFSILGFFVVVSSTAPSLAQDSTSLSNGNGLYATCKSEEVNERLRCLAYLDGYIKGSQGTTFEYALKVGISNKSELTKSGIMPFCLPEGVTMGQIRDVVTRSLESNPEQRHEMASWLVMKALQKGFPCI